MSKLLSSLPLFLAALGGVGLAWLYLQSGWVLPAFLLVLVGLVGLICDSIGRRQLPCRPDRAHFLIGLWSLFPIALAAGASAAIIGVAIATKKPESLSVESQQLIAAGASSLTVFLTSVFVDQLATPLSTDRIRKAYWKAYNDPFLKSEPNLRSKVFDQYTRWTFAYRKEISDKLFIYVSTLPQCK